MTEIELELEEKENSCFSGKKNHVGTIALYRIWCKSNFSHSPSDFEHYQKLYF